MNKGLHTPTYAALIVRGSWMRWAAALFGGLLVRSSSGGLLTAGRSALRGHDQIGGLLGKYWGAWRGQS
jgi:hypothetical protein